MKAGRIALEKIKEFFLNKITFNQETTLCGNSILRTIKKAKDLGYTIDLHFVSVDSPEIAKERVHQRVLKGGHGIPEESIERRFYESRENLKKIISLCDKITIYNLHIIIFHHYVLTIDFIGLNIYISFFSIIINS